MDTVTGKHYHLPQELWEMVMTHFHSSYKKPLHYEAIMNCKDFMRRRDITKCFGHSPMGNLCKHGVYDSFYIWIVLNNWIYWDFDDLNIRKSTVTMVRKVAKGKVKKEFEEIWGTYANHSNENNLLSRIHY